MMSRAVVRLFLLGWVLFVGAVDQSLAQEQASQPQADAAHAQPAAADHSEEDAHEAEGLLPTVARLVNFAIVAGVLVYYLRAPILAYLGTRSQQIRQDLVMAADIRRTATTQLGEIERRLASLPGELEALRARGLEDIQAEERRIAQAAEAERGRLLDQTRREIDMQLRVARRALTEHAAQLAVSVAERRISGTITSEDQLRLLDRYSTQLREAR